MLRRLLCSASLASLFLFGVISVAPSPSLLAHAGQQPEAKEAVTGKVTSIAKDAKSFSMDVNQAGNQKTMQFQVNETTQVQGRVTVGTSAKVEYQPNADGSNTALTITSQSSQPQKY
jgi:hypothetical protein